MSTEKKEHEKFYFSLLLINVFVIFISRMLEFQAISYFWFLASKTNIIYQVKTRVELTLKKSKANANATSTPKIRNT